MKVGDKVKLNLDEEISKAEKLKGYMTPSVLRLLKGINGRTGIIDKIDGDKVFVRGKQGTIRIFNKKVLITG